MKTKMSLTEFNVMLSNLPKEQREALIFKVEYVDVNTSQPDEIKFSVNIEAPLAKRAIAEIDQQVQSFLRTLISP